MTRPRRRALLPILAALFMAAPLLPAHATPFGHIRDGSVVSANAGWGWTRIRLAGGSDTVPADLETDHEDAFGGMLRYGFAPSDGLMYGVQLGGWKKTFDGDTATLFFFEGFGTWFPREGGFFVRGAIGWGSLDLTLRRPFAELRNVTFQEGGISLGGGIGYELRLQADFALGLAFDGHWVDIGDFADLRDVRAVNYLLSLNFAYYL
ncbi:MAG: hypothetical protein R6X25_11870 [Candidatus Krumholzibacteriia bacterium]